MQLFLTIISKFTHFSQLPLKTVSSRPFHRLEKTLPDT